MVQTVLSDQKLLEVIERRPENLLFAETEQLLDFLDDDGNDGEDALLRTVLAELVARWCQSGSCRLEQELARRMPCWHGFVDWYNVRLPWEGARTVPAVPLWTKDPESVPGCEVAVRARLRRLFAADGFIPVYNDLGAWFLPFAFDPAVEGIAWADGRPVDEWKDAARRALEGTGVRGARLQIRPGPELSGERNLAGDSLMLPLRLAAWRKSGTGMVPRYDPLRVLATGRLDADGRLAPVGLRRKLAAMKIQFRDAVLFGPDVPDEVDGRTKRSFRAIECGSGDVGILANVRLQLERAPDLVSITAAYACRRLPDMEIWVDCRNHARWSEVADQLLLLKDSVPARLDADTHLEYLSMLATALCHAGRTEDSLCCNAEARAFARAHGAEAKELRLRIAAVAAAQDMGDFDCLPEKALAELAGDLTRFDGPEKGDLLMRYHGSLAQAHAWGTLLGLRGFSSEASFENAEQAVGCAYENFRALSMDAGQDALDAAWSNVSQDLNYLHLWHATFRPGSDAEERAWREAGRNLHNIPSEETRETNRLHLLRQRSLALFNAWRATGLPSARADRAAVRLPAPPAAEGWLVAANRRHLGALAAAAGETDEAKACFAEGDAALPLAGCFAPVLASIRYALLAQAVLSLRACGAEAEAETYVAQARETHARFCESALFALLKAKDWQRMIEIPGCPADALPQFYY